MLEEPSRKLTDMFKLVIQVVVRDCVISNLIKSLVVLGLDLLIN